MSSVFCLPEPRGPTGQFHLAHAQREVRLCARQIEHAVAAEQLQLELRVACAQLQQARTHERAGQCFGRRAAKPAADGGLGLTRRCLQRACLCGHALGVHQQALTRGRDA